MSTKQRLTSPLSTDHQNVSKKIKLTKFALDHEVKCVQNRENLEQFFNDDDDDFLDLKKFEFNGIGIVLTSGKWTRCRVKSFHRNTPKFDLVVHVTSEENVESAGVACHLQGPWANTRLAIGDLISLQPIWDNELKCFTVNKDEGFIVIHPDLLVSGTTVVGSLFCQRKAVLQERFRGIDANSKVMVVGSLVHELFQIVLNDHLMSMDQINVACEKLMKSRDMAFMLYGSCLKYEDIVTEVQQFIPNIYAFVQQYIKSSSNAEPPRGNFQGRIAEIKDIEENLWIPQFGLKGKVDVSVKIANRKNSFPLELKTGRATFSLEHKGQLILYQMMLNSLGRDTQSGLLLYLREGIMREVRGQRNEQRDLIMLRNELAHYLSKSKEPFVLPEPISHHSACSKCAYATICCTFAHSDAHLQLSASNPLNQLIEATTTRLQEADIAYFMKWCNLLNLEEQEVRNSNYMSALWTQSAEERQQLGRTLTKLSLKNQVVKENSRYLHTFCPESKGDEVDFTKTAFSKGEYVIISSSKRLAIAAGFINEVSPSAILVSLERNLQKNYASELFILDKHESQASQVFNYTNLGLLLEDSEQAARLRLIIVEKAAPTYAGQLPRVLAQKGMDILKALNKGQRAALLHALTTDSCMLIKGLPGTGKTQTLVAIVRLLHLLGKTVLITSHTHSAVDNLLVRLLPYSNIKMLRLGSEGRVHAQLVENSESVQLRDCATEQDLARCYAKFDVVGVTCLGCSHNVFLHRKFDYCIVDEATQVLQPTVLRALFFADKFILVGDPEQLPPLVRSREARQNGADESLFHRLDSKEFTSVLSVQYRMNKTITKLANDLTYGGNLACANDAVKMANLKLNIMNNENLKEKWLQKVLHSHIDMAVFVLDTLDCSERSLNYAAARLLANIKAKESDEQSEETFNRKKKHLNKYINYCDAGVIFYIVRALLNVGYKASDIGIVAPYRAQVELLQLIKCQHQVHQPALDYEALEVNTVDQYQGRDKDIIIYSGARTAAASQPQHTERLREFEILADKRRLTVAITRAKYKLILVGDVKCLEQYTVFRDLFSHIPKRCKMPLEDNKLDFKWSKIFEELDMVLGN